MAYQALYRKYRPKNFEDFIDQDNVKRILVNSIKNNKIGSTTVLVAMLPVYKIKVIRRGIKI